MAISPVSGSDAAASATTGETAFDTAIQNAQSNEMTPEMEEMMGEGMIKVGGQMIMMPLANDILKEAMSDE
ncbi:hypothetical protein [Falsirhodobacter halotolerans]|uniref:hypothetical protein n=1 Tax=Falsirhodobacter halotolerans TaxID=1146892 RepID=UPI001FD515B3|nr:hypothetical protein [Falsirhodobacter halotolerans]MCJ8141073.1 hypothetical protein [Falsirhodobacter halotolerans]